MKTNFLIMLLIGQLAFVTKIYSQNIAINGTGSMPDTSAMLDVSSTNKGFLAPRMTDAQQNAIPLPANGLLVYNTTYNVFKVNTGTTGIPVWTPLTAGITEPWFNVATGTSATTNTQNIYQSGNVGIGVNNPGNPLVVNNVIEIRRPTTSSIAQLLFTNTSGSGDFRLGGDGGDVYWQGGGGRALQMGSFWTTILGGDRQTTTFPTLISGITGTSVIVAAQRDASVALGIQGNSATQSANLTEWRNSGGTILSAIDELGNLGLGTSTPAQKLHVNGQAIIATLSSGAATDSIVTVDATGLLKKRSASSITAQTIGTGIAGNDFNIVTTGPAHTLNLPDASTTARGVVTTGLQTYIGAKTWNSAGTFNAGLTAIGGTVNLNTDATANGVNIGTLTNTGAITLGGTGAQTINIGNGAAAKTVNLGSINTTSATTILSGSGGVLINAANNQPTNIGTGTSTGIITLGGTGAQTLSVGNGAGAKTVNLGSSNTTSATTILSGSGGVLINVSNNQPTNIATGTSTGAVAIGGTGVQAINVGTGATGVKTIGIGTGAVANVISIGSTTGAASLSQRIGTGNFSLDGVGASTYSIGASTTNGTLTIGGTAQTGAITIGSSSAIQAINIGTGTASANVTIGNDGTANGNGVRFGNGRLTINKSVAPTITTMTGNVSMTVSQILDAGVLGYGGTNNLDYTLTFPTAASLVQALPGTPAIGDMFSFAVYNSNTGNSYGNTLSFVGGSGVTIVNSNPILGTVTRVVYCRVTNVTSGAEAISVY